jgi:hypothetical protein
MIQVRQLMKLRREVSDIAKEIDRFIEEFRDIDKRLAEVCTHGSVSVYCTPRGCVVHIYDSVSSDIAKVTILVQPNETAVIDWSKNTHTVVGDDEASKVVRDMGAERDLSECISGYLRDVEDRIAKLKAMLALINIA